MPGAQGTAAAEKPAAELGAEPPRSPGGAPVSLSQPVRARAADNRPPILRSRKSVREESEANRKASQDLTGMVAIINLTARDPAAPKLTEGHVHAMARAMCEADGDARIPKCPEDATWASTTYDDLPWEPEDFDAHGEEGERRKAKREQTTGQR